MKTDTKNEMIDMRVKLSTLWIVILCNMIMADIVGFMNPGELEKIMTGNIGIHITQELLLLFSILLEIPIAMIFLSRVLNYRANRLANIIGAAITIVFVIGGGDTYLSYIFFAAVEVICLTAIIYLAWKWTKLETLGDHQLIHKKEQVIP